TALNPRSEDLREAAACGALVELDELGVDARFNRALAQKCRAEGVDGADERAVEVLERSRGLVCAGRFELLPHAHFHLARGLMGERDRDDALHRHTARDRVGDFVDEFGGLAGAGRRFDETSAICGCGSGHRSFLIAARSRSSGWLLRAARTS